MNEWYTSSIGVRVSPFTGVSGLNYYYTCTTTSSTCTPNSYSTAASVVKTLSSQSSSNKVCARVYSASGASSDVICSSSYKIDTVAPTCGTVTGESTVWTASNRTIKVACSDSTSGCRTNPTTSTFSSSRTTGTVYLYDQAGNSRGCTVDVYVDKGQPTLYAEYRYFSAKGTLSGVSKYYDVANGNDLIINNGVLQSGSFSSRTSHYRQYNKANMSPGVPLYGYCNSETSCHWEYRGCYRRNGQTYSRDWGTTTLGGGGVYYNYQYRYCNEVGTCSSPVRGETWYDGYTGTDTCQVY